MQERHYPDSQPPGRPLPRKLAALGAALATAALALLASGCPEAADLENADDYAAPINGTAGSMSNPMGDPCETPCVTEIFTGAVCATCHQSGLSNAGLDLKSPGVTARLKDVAATHGDIGGMPACPSGDKLVDTAKPADSWLWKKVTMQQGACGDPMPQSGAFPMEAVTCVKTYVECVAGKPIDAAGGT